MLATICSGLNHLYVLSAKFIASLARFCSARQLLGPLRLNNDVFPTIIQDFLDSPRNIDHLLRRHDLVIPMNVSVEQLIVPKVVLLKPELIHVIDFCLMLDRADAAQ